MFISQDELDYHGLGPLTPFDIEERLDKFLEDSFVSGLNYVTIITGKGAKVRPLVERLLGRNKYVKKYRTGGYFNGQDGAFEVELGNSHD